MKALIQRVTRAAVEVDQQMVGAIDRGLLVFLAVEPDDDEQVQEKLLRKVLGYRVFGDEQGRMNFSVQDVQGELLIVSQFTLAADTRKGMRPSFSGSAPPEQAQKLYQGFVERARAHIESGGLCGVASGQFAADMQVSLVNDGPVTFWLAAH